MTIKQIATTLCLVFFSSGAAYGAEGYTVAAYYFPGWHADVKNRLHTPGWTGWDQLKAAAPRFPGHQQPKQPLWGYEDETVPSVMEKKIVTAARYGVNAFIFDWYYNNSGPYLNGALDRGFLAANRNRIKFAIMWANHSINNESAIVSDRTYDTMTDTLVGKYFKNESYLKIGNKPYFSIYDIDVFLKTFGGIEGAASALDKLRQKAKKAGFDGIYLSIVEWRLKSHPDAYANFVLRRLSADCIDSYVWVHRSKLQKFPETAYSELMPSAIGNWYVSRTSYALPFNPNVTMGWDPSPRAKQQGAPWKQGAYPNTPVITGNTPEHFSYALREAKKFLDRSGSPYKMLTINAWNEWTEGSYLEPDRISGYKYLEAIHGTFDR